MAFSFTNNANKPAPSSGTSTPSLFGAAPAANNAPKPLFGGGAPAGGSLFGGGAAASSGASPFGITATSGPAKLGSGSGATTGNIFGNSGATTPQPQQGGGGGLFGGAAPASSSAQPSGGLFGGGAAAGGNAFGGLSANQSGRSTPTFSFGAPKNDAGSGAQTPASTGAAPATGGSTLFGGGQSNAHAPAAPSGGSSLFGGGAPAAASGGLFGGLNKPAGASTPGTQSPGGSAAPSTTLFGSQTPAAPAAQQSKPAGSSLFGGAIASPAPGLLSIGNKETPASSASASGGLFSSLGGGSAQPAGNATTTPQGNKTQPMPSFTPAGNPPANAGLFGGGAAAKPTPSLFNQPAKPDENKQPEAPKTGGFSFGGAAATPAPAKPAAPLFGEVRPDAQKDNAAANAPPTPAAPSLFSGGFGQKTNAAPATSAAPTSNLFGGGSTPAASVAQPATTSTSTSTAPATSNLFGAAPTSTSTTTTAAPAPSDTTSTDPAAHRHFAPSQSTQPTAPTSRLQSKSLEEILTTWSTSLATHQTRFASLASTVSTWDRALTTNSTAISKLYARCFQAERDAAEVERQLSVVENEQRGLEALLNRCEDEVDGLMEQAGLSSEGSGPGQSVDQERERVYGMAENCSDRLTEMNQSLAAMIEGINSSSSALSSASKGSKVSGDGGDDPLAQIVRTLNRHLGQLGVVDEGAEQLRRRVEGAMREVDGAGRGLGGIGGGGRESE
ncbi:FG-nucleoporin nsp1, partial [Oleoguttula sp. CCFEE 5521]